MAPVVLYLKGAVYMPEGVIILSEWTDLSGLSGLILFIGLVLFLVFAIVSILAGEDLEKNWLCVCIIVAVIGLGMVIGSLCMPKDHGHKITLTDDAKFSEIVKHYEIVDVDNLILKVKERE